MDWGMNLRNKEGILIRSVACLEWYEGIIGKRVFELDGHLIEYFFLYEIRTAKEAKKRFKIVEEIS